MALNFFKNKYSKKDMIEICKNEGYDYDGRFSHTRLAKILVDNNYRDNDCEENDNSHNNNNNDDDDDDIENHETHWHFDISSSTMADIGISYNKLRHTLLKNEKKLCEELSKSVSTHFNDNSGKSIGSSSFGTFTVWREPPKPMYISFVYFFCIFHMCIQILIIQQI